VNLDDLLLTDEELADLTPAENEQYLAILATAKAAVAGPTAWRDTARPDQLPPEGEWSRLFLRGGRGSGKSHASARILTELILADPARATEGPGQWAIVAPTYGDARDTCVEAPGSGLLAALGTSRAEVVAGRSARVELWNRSLGELRLRDGAVVFVDGADDGALRIQGKNLRGVWCDEIGLWRNWEQAFDESIAFALRKGDARLVASGTPKSAMPARALVRRLLTDPGVVVRRLRTFDNRENLSAAFLAVAEQRVGTRLARQELEGELLEDVEGALWRRDWIDDARVDGPPHGGFRSVALGLDPADGTATGAEQGITIAAAGVDRELYVLHSEGVRASPLEWLKRAVRLAREYNASRIVVEKNHGGGFLIGLLEQAMDELGIRVAYRVVTASQGKWTRAEPIAMLYETGRVHHVGRHDALEEQLLSWTGAPGEKSPDILDSLVWTLSDLQGLARRGGTGAGGDAIRYRDDSRGVPGGAIPWAGADQPALVVCPSGWGWP